MTGQTPTEASISAPPGGGIGRLLQNSSVYLAANVAAKLIGFVMIPFYARFLSTEEYGVINLLELATAVIAIAFGLQSAGQALTRIYSEQIGDAARRQAVSTALICTVVLAGGTALLAGAFAGPIARAVSLPGQSALLRVAFAGMFAGSVAEVALVYQRMRDRARFYFVYAMATLALNLGLNIVLIGWLHQGVWGFVDSKLVVTGLGCAMLLTRIAREVGLAWHPAIARALARFAGPLIVSGGCYFAVHFSDRLFLAQVSKAQVGVYAMSYNFAFLLSVLVGDSFNKSWSVSMYGLASGDGWQHRFVGVGRWLLLVLGAGALGISLFGRDVLTMMVPPAYVPPPFLLPVLVFGYFLREVGDFFGSMLLIGIGSGLVGRIALAGAALNLAFNAVLIPRYGIWGAAWATFATWAAYCAFCWVFAWRVHRIVLPPRPFILVASLCAAGLWSRWLFAPAGLARLVVDGAVFAAFLAVSAAIYLSANERSQALAVMHRLVERGRAFRRSGSRPVSHPIQR